jgi:hypothetical protein
MNVNFARALANADSPINATPARLEALIEGARDLILAIFRQAVGDYLGYEARDGELRVRKVSRRRRREAAAFLQSARAEHLAGLIGLSSEVIWAEAQRRDEPSVYEDQAVNVSRSAAKGSGGTAAHRFPRGMA